MSVNATMYIFFLFFLIYLNTLSMSSLCWAQHSFYVVLTILFLKFVALQADLVLLPSAL